MFIYTVQLPAQLSVQVQTGFWHDFNDLDAPDELIVTGWKGMSNYGLISGGNMYLLLRASYDTENEYRAGLRMNLNNRSSVYHWGGQFDRHTTVITTPSFDVGATASKLIPVFNTVRLALGGGVAIEYNGCECRGTSYSSEGSGRGGRIRDDYSMSYQSQDYRRNAYRWYIPLEASLQYDFNDFLVFTLDLGYEYTFNRRAQFTDYTFTINDVEVDTARIYQTDILYFGIGLLYYLPINL